MNVSVPMLPQDNEEEIPAAGLLLEEPSSGAARGNFVSLP
jgi:hypothetical protein